MGAPSLCFTCEKNACYSLVLIGLHLWCKITFHEVQDA